MIDWWRMKRGMVIRLTDLCMNMIRRLNRYKDRCLAARLYDLAADYDPNDPRTEEYDSYNEITDRLHETYKATTNPKDLEVKETTDGQDIHGVD